MRGAFFCTAVIDFLVIDEGGEGGVPLSVLRSALLANFIVPEEREMICNGAMIRA